MIEIDRYFNWICNLVLERPNYRKLMSYLNKRIFYHTVKLDGNRADDGINLRYQYGYEEHVPDSIISRDLNIGPCTVLEMMAALAVKIEKNIMEDELYGDRTKYWFSLMIKNLGLDDMDDSNFDEGYVEYVISRLLDRKYGRDGKGGLFVVKGKQDMRTLEIWYQMMRYLATIT